MIHPGGVAGLLRRINFWLMGFCFTLLVVGL